MIPKLLSFLSSRRTLSLNAEALAALQAQRLQATIRHAYQNVAYYRRLFDAAGITPDDIRTPKDLERVPTSSKEDFLNAGYDALIAGNVERSSQISASTSGSTGKAFTVQLSRMDLQRRKFLDLRALMAVGFRPRDKLAAYTVRRTSDRGKSQGLFFRSKWISALQPTDAAIPELFAYDPDLMWSYPSSFKALYEFLDGNLNVACSPRVLVTTAEAPDEEFRAACKSLGLEHFNFYGTVEVGRIAWECTAHEGLHVNMDNVILEITQPNEKHGTDIADVGETIVTTLNNEAMPFIRYRLGDLCRYLDKPCSCGNALPLISAPSGRLADLIKLPSGRLLTARGLALIIRRHEGIRQLLIIQRDLQHLEIELVVTPPQTDNLPTVLSTQLLEHLREPMDVAVRIVDSIEQHGPKARDFVSLIK